MSHPTLFSDPDRFKGFSGHFLNHYEHKTVPWGFDGLGYVTYKRTYARPIYDGDTLLRTEEWPETIARVIEGAQAIGANLTQAEAERLFDHMFNLRGLPGGRMLWQLGTENNTRLGGDSLVNCWFVDFRDVTDFGWAFERLMLGGGVGFSVLEPERLGVVRQGRVIHEPEGTDSDFIVPDKREGWSDLLMRVIRCYLPKRENDYAEFSYSTKLIRPEGAPIKTFGGVASGPGILVSGVARICEILDRAVGRTLTSVEVLDIANVIGSIVVSGNVRRSAQIAIGDPTDYDYLQAKRWDLGNVPSYRAMSNNSVYVDSIEGLPDEFWEGYKGNGEPYGMVNLTTARQYGRIGEWNYDGSIEGFNPCAEIPLAHRESCNLAEIVLPNIESREQLAEVATLLYKVQKAVAALPYLDPESDRITSQNMRLGLGITGIAQSADKLAWLSDVYEGLRDFDYEWSRKMGWPRSVRLTTVKPSGTLSLVAGVTPGGHPGYAPYHIRRMRLAANDPLVPRLREAGYRWEYQRDFEGAEDHSTVVFEFPAAFPEGTKFADEMSAVDQLRLVQFLQTVWADNAVSVTVYYRTEELPEIRDYLAEYWHSLKSVSFLLHSDHGFDQAPLEEITEARYESLRSGITPIGSLGSAGFTEALSDDACATGACPVR